MPGIDGAIEGRSKKGRCGGELFGNNVVKPSQFHGNVAWDARFLMRIGTLRLLAPPFGRIK